MTAGGPLYGSSLEGPAVIHKSFWLSFSRKGQPTAVTPNDCRFASLATKKWVKQTACQRSDVKHGEDVSHVFSLQSVANFEDQRPKAIARPKVEPWLKVARELSETAVTGRIGDGRKGKSWSGGKEWKPTA